MFPLILNIAQKDIIKHRDHVDVKHSILQWNKVEIDELRRWPNQPVGDVNFEELLPKEIIRF